MKKIVVGIIGLGVGERHLETYLGNKKCYVKYVCDFNKFKLKNFKKKYSKIKCINDSKEIFLDKEVNLVSIASFDNFHYKNILDACKYKKNIFVEKPLCLNIQEFKKIKKEVQKSEVKISSNYVLRGTSKFEIIKKLSRKIGKIFYFEGDYNYGRISKITKGWRGKIPFYSVTLGGGLHLIDIILWISSQKVNEVIAAGNNLSTKGSQFKHFDNVTAILKFANGSTAKINSNFAGMLPHHHVLQIHGSKGTIISNKTGTYLYTSRDKKTKPKMISIKSKPYEKRKVLNSFINKLIKNENCLVDRKDIFNSMNIGLAIEKSLKTMKWEKINYKI